MWSGETVGNDMTPVNAGPGPRFPRNEETRKRAVVKGMVELSLHYVSLSVLNHHLHIPTVASGSLRVT